MIKYTPTSAIVFFLFFLFLSSSSMGHGHISSSLDLHQTQHADMVVKRKSFCSHHDQEHSEAIVCFEIHDAEFDCTENDCDHNYKGCSLAIHYTVSAVNMTKEDIETSVVCNCGIVYQTGQGDILQSNSESITELKVPKEQDNNSSLLTLTFPFSVYEGVTRAQPESLDCQINAGQYADY